jgi:hypothetical protein
VNGEGAGCVGLLGPRKSWANGFSQAGQKPEMRGEKDFLFFFFSNIPKPFSNSF